MSSFFTQTKLRSLLLPIIMVGLVVSCERQPSSIKNSIRQMQITLQPGQKEVHLSIAGVDIFNMYDVLFEASKQIITAGDFSTVEEFTSSFSGVYRKASSKELHFQLGGKKNPDLEYLASVVVIDAPGVDIITEDANTWWADRADASKEGHRYISMLAGTISQTLHEQMMESL